MMDGDGGINQIAMEAPQAHQGAILVRCGEPAITDDIGDQDRSDLPRFRHGVASGFGDAIMNAASALSRGARAGVNSSRQFIISQNLFAVSRTLAQQSGNAVAEK
jgi:hypothetical protein